uniref:Uncharacterized protein n=1 Tax=Octactis speculum TaxID=3111310 RepID=A0A7S2DBX9_9STRA
MWHSCFPSSSCLRDHKPFDEVILNPLAHGPHFLHSSRLGIILPTAPSSSSKLAGVEACKLMNIPALNLLHLSFPGTPWGVEGGGGEGRGVEKEHRIAPPCRRLKILTASEGIEFCKQLTKLYQFHWRFHVKLNIFHLHPCCLLDPKIQLGRYRWYSLCEESHGFGPVEPVRCGGVADTLHGFHEEQHSVGLVVLLWTQTEQ